MWFMIEVKVIEPFPNIDEGAVESIFDKIKNNSSLNWNLVNIERR